MPRTAVIRKDMRVPVEATRSHAVQAFHARRIRVSHRNMPTRRPDVTVHEIDGEALIYDPVTTSTHRLNDTALFIWRTCDGRRNVEGIARELADRYELSAEAAEEHSSRMVKEFEKAQLVAATD
jgi:PqqD family protein of HPr-rel-A system